MEGGLPLTSPYAGVAWQTLPGSRTNGLFILPPWSCPLLPAPFGTDTCNASAGQGDPAQAPRESFMQAVTLSPVPCHPCGQHPLCGQASLADTVGHFPSWRWKLRRLQLFFIKYLNVDGSFCCPLATLTLYSIPALHSPPHPFSPHQVP